MKKPPEQLDLLSWRPRAIVFVFPPCRRAGLIRKTVAGLSKRKPGSRAFWRFSDSVFCDLHSELASLGFSADAIDVMLEDFAAEVLNERDRQQLPWRMDDHGGAA